MTASVDIFHKYLNRIFIETGTHWGDGVKQALNAGFEIIYSIELSWELYKQSRDRFKDNNDVHLFFGDSSILLEGILEWIDEPVTFWIDSHSPRSHPLLKELEIIGKHSIKTHTILIDDLRLWSKEVNGFDTEILKTILLKINPNYGFVIDGCIDIPNDILIAHIC